MAPDTAPPTLATRVAIRANGYDWPRMVLVWIGVALGHERLDHHQRQCLRSQS